MSRELLHYGNRFKVVAGMDHVLGLFLQMYDKQMISETPEGEGLVFDWSQEHGCETNFTDVKVVNNNIEGVMETVLIHMKNEAPEEFYGMNNNYSLN